MSDNTEIKELTFGPFVAIPVRSKDDQQMWAWPGGKLYNRRQIDLIAKRYGYPEVTEVRVKRQKEYLIR